MNDACDLFEKIDPRYHAEIYLDVTVADMVAHMDVNGFDKKRAILEIDELMNGHPSDCTVPNCRTPEVLERAKRILVERGSEPKP